MERRDNSYSTTSSSLVDQNEQPIRSPGADVSQRYRNAVRHSQRDQSQGYMANVVSGIEHGLKRGRLAPYTPIQSINAGIAQGAYQTRPGNSAMSPSTFTGSHTTPVAVHVDHQLNETGSQFSDNHQSTLQEQSSSYIHRNHPNPLGAANTYAGSHRSCSDDVYAQIQARSRDRGYDLPMNQSPYEQNGFTHSPSSDLAEVEPWSPYNDHLAATRFTASSPSYNMMGASNVPIAYTSISPNSSMDFSSFHRSHINHDQMPLAAALQPPIYNVTGGDGSNDSGPHHSFVSTPTSSLFSGQGRRITQAAPTDHPHENVSSPDTIASSRLCISPYTRSSGDNSDRLTRPTASLDRRTSTKTTTTTTSLASQASRSSESAPRYRNRPDPLPCPKCHKPFVGPDRITNLERHDRETHQQIRTRCPSCGKAFTRSSNVDRHREARRKKRGR